MSSKKRITHLEMPCDPCSWLTLRCEDWFVREKKQISLNTKPGAVCRLHDPPPRWGPNAPADPNCSRLSCPNCSKVRTACLMCICPQIARNVFLFVCRKALVDLRALTVLTKAKFEEAETKYAAENPGKWRETEICGHDFLNFRGPWLLWTSTLTRGKVTTTLQRDFTGRGYSH